MVSAFFGLNTGLRALIASQLALDTAAHNAANAATDGYSRQRVTLTAGGALHVPGVQSERPAGRRSATGVSVTMISRVRDAFVDLQLRQEASRSGSWTTRSEQLQRLQDVFPEPGSTGLGASLNAFWSAWQDVAADPDLVGGPERRPPAGVGPRGRPQPGGRPGDLDHRRPGRRGPPGDRGASTRSPARSPRSTARSSASPPPATSRTT